MNNNNKKKTRKFIRNLHRDLGYFFFATSIIYGVSGIAVNHRGQWNPSYIVTEEQYEISLDSANISEQSIKQFLSEIGQKNTYKKHVKKGKSKYKVFIKNGSVMLNLNEKTAYLETVKKRPIFNQFNFLHYNGAKRLWTWFSDAFAISLVVLAITGLFMVKGKHGITRLGGIFTAIGIIVPLVLFLMYA